VNSGKQSVGQKPPAKRVIVEESKEDEMMAADTGAVEP